jgi:hypothetical protein
MAGALSTMLRPRRRRFAAGGGTDEPTDQYDYATTSQPVDSGAWDVPQDNTPQPTPRGALASNQPLTSQDQVALAQRGIENLQQRQILKNAGINTPPILDPSQAPDAVNLPLLAAAGAMLQPTHSGGFAESLGKAFSAAVPVAEQQRAQTEQTQLRKAQMDTNAAIWGARTGVQQQNADTASAREGAYASGIVARNTWYGAREDALAADPKATGADVLDRAVKSLVGQTNPDTGQPYDYAGAFAKMKNYTDTNAIKLGGLAVNQQNADTARLRADTSANLGQQRIDQKTQQIQSTDDYRQAVLNLRTRMGDNANTNSLIGRATTLAAATGMTMSKAMDQVLGQQPRAAKATPSVGATQPPGGAQPSGLPLPGKKADLTDGSVYNTARGLGRWDAKSDQFVPLGQ